MTTRQTRNRQKEQMYPKRTQLARVQTVSLCPPLTLRNPNDQTDVSLYIPTERTHTAGLTWVQTLAYLPHCLEEYEFQQNLR